MMADLIHINRGSQQTESALAKSWTVSADGLRYVLELRQDRRFSDGHAFDAGDVVFTFQVMMDDKVNSPQRDLLIVEGKPRLEQAWRAGKLAEAWSLRTPPAEIAGLGPFRFKEYVAGQRYRPRAQPVLLEGGATLIQDDLKQLGMDVHVVPLEFRSLLDRVLRTHDYEACLLGLAEADADPNPDMNVWLSSGGTHLWNPQQKSPATAWEAEIDGLMRRQMVTRKYAERKPLFDRVQELLMENLPLIPLVSPNILVGAKKGLENFRPAVLDHYALWNIEELCWRGPGAGARQ